MSETTDPTTEPTQSVNERQAAEADARARASLSTPTDDGAAKGTLAAQALTLAGQAGEEPDATVARAAVYLRFLEENQNDREQG